MISFLLKIIISSLILAGMRWRRRSLCLLSAWGGVLAKEMVLAHARSSHTCSCRVLVMWALLTPLDHFEAYAEKNLLDTCRRFHAEWGIAEPLATYAVAYEYSVL